MSSLDGVSVTMTKALRQSDAFLKAKANMLSQFDNVDHLVTDESILSEKDRDAIAHHILQLRAALARSLWSHEVYVGRSLLDDFVLQAAKDGAGDVPNRVITDLGVAGVELPGFVLYPLTGFGMEMPPILSRTSNLRAEAVFRKAGFAVSTQTNSIETAVRSVQRLARALGIKQRIEPFDLQHFGRSARWFGRNPLMLVRLTSHTGDMYENQFVYTLKIRFASAHLLMLHALSLEAEGRIDRYKTSSFVNNFSTLDIAHYAIGEARRGKAIRTERIPMNVSPLELARLSDVAAVLSTDALATPRMKRHEHRITAALQIVERGYFKHVNLASKAKPENRLYRRLVTALDWYRQSFSARANESEAIVAIAVALETLLTDQFAPGIGPRLSRRIGICMRGVRGVGAHRESIGALYKARSEIVHAGAADHAIEIQRAQVAFIGCFCAIAERLPTASIAANNAMGVLLGDTMAADEENGGALA